MLRLYKAGKSLRGTDETNLGLQTVRTIVDAKQRMDRTSKVRREKIEIDEFQRAHMRRQKRDGDALPKQVNKLIETGRALVTGSQGVRAKTLVGAQCWWTFEGPAFKVTLSASPSHLHPLADPGAATMSDIVERTIAEMQMVLPGCERRTLPRLITRVDDAGQGLLHLYRPPSLREQLASRADAPS